MHEGGFVSVGGHQLHYLRYGNGPNLILAFHGYGDTANSFRGIASLIASQYTLLSVDLPFHGASHWTDGSVLDKETLKRIVEELLSQTGYSKCSLIGYSIGGRVCLNIIELMPERVEQVVLIAPDGLYPNRLYYFVTRTTAGQYLFNKFLLGGKKYNRIIEGLYDFRLIDPSRYKFAMRYLENDEHRKLLLRVWPTMSQLLPNGAVVKEHLRTYRIPVDIFMGRYDHVIPPRRGRQFVKEMPDYVRLHVLEKGHVMFDTDSIQKMADCLLGK